MAAESMVVDNTSSPLVLKMKEAYTKGAPKHLAFKYAHDEASELADFLVFRQLQTILPDFEQLSVTYLMCDGFGGWTRVHKTNPLHRNAFDSIIDNPDATQDEKVAAFFTMCWIHGEFEELKKKAPFQITPTERRLYALLNSHPWMWWAMDPKGYTDAEFAVLEAMESQLVIDLRKEKEKEILLTQRSSKPIVINEAYIKELTLVFDMLLTRFSDNAPMPKSFTHIQLLVNFVRSYCRIQNLSFLHYCVGVALKQSMETRGENVTVSEWATLFKGAELKDLEDFMNFADRVYSCPLLLGIGPRYNRVTKNQIKKLRQFQPTHNKFNWLKVQHMITQLRIEVNKKQI